MTSFPLSEEPHGRILPSYEAVPVPSQPQSDLERAAYPVLSDPLLRLLDSHGTTRTLAPGETLFKAGDETYDFIYVQSGALRLVDPQHDRLVSIFPPGSFVGELSLLTGQSVFMTCTAERASIVVAITQEELKRLIAASPEFCDVAIPALAARRRVLIQHGLGGCVVVGTEDAPGTVALLSFLGRNRIAYRFVDRDDAETVAELKRSHGIPDDETCVITHQGSVLRRPTVRDLSDDLGLTLEPESSRIFDVTIVGAGPSGLAAAVYGASEGLETLVIDDTAVGGQAGTSSRIENYLGFSTGISGEELAYQGMIQALKFGASFAVPRRVVSIGKPSHDDQTIWVLELDDGTKIKTRTVVLANGIRYRRLPLERLEDFEGSGVYYAATELESRLCKNQTAVIVGGGNSAGQAAMFLSRYAKRTLIVVRGPSLSATMSSYLADRIRADERIELLTESEVSKLRGTDRLEGIMLRDRTTGEETEVPTAALFVMVGAVPHTEWLEDAVALDNKGFIETGVSGGPYATSAPGIFAVGDVRSTSIKRVASAVGEGSVVVSGVHTYLTDLSRTHDEKQEG